MKKNLRKLTITVTAQTAYHLKEMADAYGHRDPGRVVDKLVREHQMAAKATPGDLIDAAMARYEEIEKRRKQNHGNI